MLTKGRNNMPKVSDLKKRLQKVVDDNKKLQDAKPPKPETK